jgi:choline monooxygenase
MTTVATKPARPPLEHALEDGWTLPASWYSDPAVLALERERIFASAWTYAAPAEWVAESGSYVAAQVGHVPIVVVRDRDGELRGFVNVCRETLQCPYHAWTYDLDGTLRRAPRSEREPGFDATAFSLHPISVGTWGPFVFANPDPEAEPLADTLGELPEIVASSGLDVDALRFHSHHEWPIASNWKVAIENYLECYHCPVAHPGFSALIDVAEGAYTYETQRWTSSQYAPVRPAALDGTSTKPVAYDAHGEVEEAQYHLIWPNCTINIDPGRANLSIDVWRPDGPETTRGFSDQFFAADVPEELRREMIAFSQQVGLEDDALVESVQRGLRSGMVPEGRLILGSERLIQHFQELVAEALA